MESVEGPRDPLQQQLSITWKQPMATAADLMTLQQQIRQEMADSLQRVREDMHTAINGRLGAISKISSAMPEDRQQDPRTGTEELGRQP